MTPKSPDQDRASAAPGAEITRVESLIGLGHYDAARKAARPLLAHAEVALRAHAAIANAAAQLGDFQQAVDHYAKLRAALPHHEGLRMALSMALNNLGSAALHEGDPRGAEARYHEAVQVDERNALAWFNLGASAQTRSAYDDACLAYRKVLSLEPARVEASFRLATCERLRGDIAGCSAALRGAAQGELSAETALQIGGEFEIIGEALEAENLFARARAAAPDNALNELSIAVAKAGSGDVAGVRQACASAEAHAGDSGLALRAALYGELALPAVAEDAAAIDRARARFAQGVSNLSERWPASRIAKLAMRLDDFAVGYYELGYQGHDDRALVSDFGDWYAEAIDAAAAPLRLAPRAAVPRRIALVSSRWNMSTITAYFGAWIDDLTQAGFEVFIYQLDSARDAWTTEVARRATAFRHLPGPLEDSVRALRDDAPALILYPEIGLNPRVQALAALRLAPRQAAAWGHPVTTGLPTLDAYFSCAEMEPEHGATHYRERLFLLPRLGTRYLRPPVAAQLDRAALGVPEGRTLYLAPHPAVKVHPDYDALLAEVARRDPQAAFVMFRDHEPARTQRRDARIRARFRALGLDFDRHQVLLPRMTLAKFRALLRVGAVLLDTPHFSGGNTSLDAIAQGLPVVTVAGATMRGRQTAAMVRLCGVEELCVATAAQQADLAVRIAGDSAYRDALSTRLLGAADELFDDQRPSQALVQHVEALLA